MFNISIKKVNYMYSMSQKTKDAIEETVGLPIQRISMISISDEKKWIEKKTNKELVFSRKRRHGIIGRGNPLLARKIIRTMGYIDNKIATITGLK